MAGEATSIIEKRYFNYRTVSHLYRHAVRRHLKWLREESPKLRSRVSWAEEAITIIQTGERVIECQAITGYLAKTVPMLQEAGEEEEARQMVLAVINLISDGDAPQTIKRRYLKLIIKRHGHLLQGGTSGKPSQFEED